MPSSSPWTLVIFLTSAAALSALGAGCFGDDDIDTSARRDGGTFFVPDGAGAEVDPLANCPTAPPKDGETCPAVTEARLSCTFTVDVCTVPTGSYDVTVDYCCGRGGTWALCGANSTPCDQGRADAGAVD